MKSLGSGGDVGISDWDLKAREILHEYRTPEQEIPGRSQIETVPVA
jgi:hypothetical protein